MPDTNEKKKAGCALTGAERKDVWAAYWSWIRYLIAGFVDNFGMAAAGSAIWLGATTVPREIGQFRAGFACAVISVRLAISPCSISVSG